MESNKLFVLRELVGFISLVVLPVGIDITLYTLDKIENIRFLKDRGRKDCNL